MAPKKKEIAQLGENENYDLTLSDMIFMISTELEEWKVARRRRKSGKSREINELQFTLNNDKSFKLMKSYFHPEWMPEVALSANDVLTFHFTFSMFNTLCDNSNERVSSLTGSE